MFLWDVDNPTTKKNMLLNERSSPGHLLRLEYLFPESYHPFDDTPTVKKRTNEWRILPISKEIFSLPCRLEIPSFWEAGPTGGIPCWIPSVWDAARLHPGYDVLLNKNYSLHPVSMFEWEIKIFEWTLMIASNNSQNPCSVIAKNKITLQQTSYTFQLILQNF